MSDAIERLIAHLLAELSPVQRGLLVWMHRRTYESALGDGISGATLDAMHRKGLINRSESNGWDAEITWLGTLVALRAEAQS